MDGRFDVDKRRLAQETESEAARGRKYKAKLTTRGDVMAIIELYNTHKILPLAARLDAAESALRYLTAPWWQRRWWDAKIIGGKVHNWLERRGIHLYTLDTDLDTDPEVPPEEPKQDPDAHGEGAQAGAQGCRGDAHLLGGRDPGRHRPRAPCAPRSSSDQRNRSLLET